MSRPSQLPADDALTAQDHAIDRQLLQAARELAFARDLETVTAIVNTTARLVTGADGVTFVLRDGAQCHYADEDAIAPLWKGRRFPLDSCISGWVMRRGEPVAIADVYKDDRIPHDAYRPTFVKSLAMVPVKTPDPVAAIGAYWADAHVATGSELRALRILAESAALALSNVQLYGELRRAVDQQQKARVAAEVATTAKDNFLAIVAHELRQPLAAATTSLSVLRANPPSSVRDRAESLIERQLLRMTRLVEDLLDASLIVRGDVALHVRRHEVRDIVDAAIDSARSAIDDRGHSLIVRNEAAAGTVDGDAARLEQVLINLLQNAAKFTPHGGTLAVEVGGDRHEVTIAVRDNGVGIAADRLETIFELFNRVTEGTESGFGIGLAVARTLATRHGGTLRAHSAGPGRGSTFTLRLPRRSLAAGEVAAFALAKLGRGAGAS